MNEKTNKIHDLLISTKRLKEVDRGLTLILYTTEQTSPKKEVDVALFERGGWVYIGVPYRPWQPMEELSDAKSITKKRAVLRKVFFNDMLQIHAQIEGLDILPSYPDSLLGDMISPEGKFTITEQDLVKRISDFIVKYHEYTRSSEYRGIRKEFVKSWLSHN